MEPFYGNSGELLDATFNILEVRKQTFAIANVVSHNPPGNRPSSAIEIKNCSSYIHEIISLLKPKVVITLGRDATEIIKERTYSLKRSLERRVWIKSYTPTSSKKYSRYVWIIEGHPSYYYRSNDRKICKEYSERLAFKIKSAWKIAKRRGI